MYYFEVLVSSNKFHGDSSLTYSSKNNIQVGSLVVVQLRSIPTTGIVIKNTSKPKYKVKPIAEIFDQFVLPTATIKLINWLANYYPANISSVVSLFIPKQLTQRTAETSAKSINTLNSRTLTELPKLTTEQNTVINKINNDTSNTSFLLHGETGTGKTRVYIELAQKQLSSGKSCLILTPEISLTPQLLAEFQNNITSPTYVLHSNLTEAQKRNIWINIILSTEPVVVIGPRSILFSPIINLGLVVIDECHDSSYKQDQFPKYNALFVAGHLAKQHGAKLILGSATPNIADYFLLKKKKLPILRMKENATGVQHKPDIEVVNIKDKKQFSSNGQLSEVLVKAIKATLRNNMQSLIFLNKRGSARLVSCNTCGWVELCPNCQIPLTFHQDQHTLRCHTCGFSKSAIINCSNCSSSDIAYKMLGTKSLFDQLNRLFPEATIMRFDTDSTKTEKLENNYDKVRKGQVDIIVGTQILAKGLDLPKLGLVGIVSADSNLSFPDYRSEENNFQLLKQIIGRVSRGHTKGRVIVQTLSPDSASLSAAINNDWDVFYYDQLQQRQEFNLPPFSFVLKIIIQRKTLKSIHSTANRVLTAIKPLDLPLEISGPAPRFNEMAMGTMNWQIIIKSKKRSDLLQVISSLPPNVNYDLDPTNLL